MKTFIRITLVVTVALFGTTASTTTTEAAMPEASAPEAICTTDPDTPSGGTCVDRAGATCYVYNPYFPADPVEKEGACNSDSEGCDIPDEEEEEQE